MKLALLSFIVTSVSAWSVTFHDHDQCAGGTTFHYGGGSNTGAENLAQCFTMTSIDKSYANYDAKSVNIVFGGCTIDIFTDRLTSPGLAGCVASNSEPSNWQRINHIEDDCIQVGQVESGKVASLVGFMLSIALGHVPLDDQDFDSLRQRKSDWSN
ncbi:hypothetical protein CKAH01_13957 [Colletotrichum kahawae]|uniref:Cyanovirin-N domain-containing protein n=1 Tax=Colletotrichum kahawae TaxID=34407 RepID=A0AAE0D955_COLKA|nr:hypothetical protein CKAH01_13957 [Colletotrichum kahawae]